MWAAIKAVMWSFFGVRKQVDYESDQKQLKIGHVIAAGIFCCLLFVFGLLMLVRFITK